MTVETVTKTPRKPKPVADMLWGDRYRVVVDPFGRTGRWLPFSATRLRKRSMKR